MSTTTLQPPPVATIHPTRENASNLRMAIAVAMMVLGLSFMGLTLVVNLFNVGSSFESLTDGFRPVMTQQSVTAAQQDIATLSAASAEYQAKVVPTLAKQLGVTPAQLTWLMSQQYPAVSKGMTVLPTMVPAFNGIVTTLDQQRPLFASADAIPTKDQPATTLPWMLLFTGAGVLGLGIYTWFAPRRGAEIAVVVGALLVAAPFMLSLPQKAADADQMNSNLKPFYTQQLITNATAGLTTVGAMGTEMQTKMVPALAEQLNMTPAQLQTYMAANFPATAKALSDMPAAMGRFDSLVTTFQQHLSDYKVLKPVSLAPIVWFMIVGGGLLLLLGASDLFLTRSRYTS